MLSHGADHCLLSVLGAEGISNLLPLLVGFSLSLSLLKIFILILIMDALEFFWQASFFP